jgi:hypothetical protein
MSEDVLDNFPPSFPTRFRGYDRDAVDRELHELHSALDYAQAERDRAVARALAHENAAPSGSPAPSSTSASVQWLIDTAEQDARRIRAEAEEAARAAATQAEEMLRRRVELVEEAQHEADVCRAQAAEEARLIVHEALEKANALLSGLQDSESALQELFAGGSLSHRMPPPRRSIEQSHGQHAAMPQPAPAPQIVPQTMPFPANDDGQHTVPPQAIGGPAPQQVIAGQQMQGTLPPS